MSTEKQLVNIYTVSRTRRKCIIAAKIRKFIAAVQIMLEQMGITRYVQWVVENRTRQDPDSGLFKPSFHIYADVWFPNNYELLPAFVREALRRANVSMAWVDFGVYQPRSLMRMIGVSSKTYHPLLRAEEDHFYMSLTASLTEIPDVTADHMQQLDIVWEPRRLPEISSGTTSTVDQNR